MDLFESIKEQKAEHDRLMAENPDFIQEYIEVERCKICGRHHTLSNEPDKRDVFESGWFPGDYVEEYGYTDIKYPHKLRIVRGKNDYDPEYIEDKNAPRSAFER